MKLTVLLCLAIVLISYHAALAKKKITFGKLFNKIKNPKPKDDFKSKPSLFNQGSVHKQDTPGSPYNYRPQQPGQGGIGEHGGHGGYPGQGRYPAQGGYPGQGQYPGHRGYPGQGGYPGYGGYGGYINQNPNNHILSPHYGGYGGYVPGRGSPYSRTVQAMGYVPSEKSKGFGRSAVMAAAGGAVAGMALGYGLGRFPRPHFHFHSPEEEYYYNYYMYRRYGRKPPDDKGFSRDPKAPRLNYDEFMTMCMKANVTLPGTKKSKLTTPTTITTTSTVTTTTSVSPSVPSNMTRNTTAHNSTSPGPTISANPKPSEASPGNSSGAPAAMADSYTGADEDDDGTVSVVEIGYPALIKQLKVRKCLDMYSIYYEHYLRNNPKGSGQCWESSQWLLLVLSVVIVMVT